MIRELSRKSTENTLLFNKLLDPTRLEEAHVILSGLNPDHANRALKNSEMRCLNTANNDDFVSSQIVALSDQVKNCIKPCIVFDTNGQMAMANSQAISIFAVNPGTTLEDLALSPEDQSILQTVLRDFEVGKQSFLAPRVLRVKVGKESLLFSMVLTPTELKLGKLKYVAAILIDTAENPKFIADLSGRYALSKSESVVLSLFMCGKTLKEISVIRTRSLATIKTQFYTISRKLGTTSQQELLGKLFTLSISFSSWESIDRSKTNSDKNSQNPFRQKASILRPGGRNVEVVLSGDFNGHPVIHVPTLFQGCFPRETEKMFREAEKFVITIVPPGRGQTSAPHPDLAESEVFAGDIIAVLDQLSIEKAIFFGTDDLLGVYVLLAQKLGARMKHIVITSPVLPAVYENSSSSSGHIFTITKRLHFSKPKLRRISMKMFWRALAMLGPRGMIKLFFRNIPSDTAACFEPNTFKEIEAAHESVLSAGFERCAQFHESTFDDWQTQIERCPVPITIYEGSKSLLCDTEQLSAFVTDYCTVVRLVTLETQGTSLPYIRPDLMVKMICSITDEMVLDV